MPEFPAVDELDEDVLEARLVGREILVADLSSPRRRISDAIPVLSAWLSNSIAEHMAVIFKLDVPSEAGTELPPLARRG